MIYEMRIRVELDTDDEAVDFFTQIVEGGPDDVHWERSDIIKYQDPAEADAAEGLVH